jgi:hypothetical protein
VLSALNLFSAGRVPADAAVTAIGLAFTANALFKLGVLFWLGDSRTARRVVLPILAALAGGAATLVLVG